MKYRSKEQLESLVKRLLQEELEMHVKQLREAEEDVAEAKSSRSAKYLKSKKELKTTSEPSQKEEPAITVDSTEKEEPKNDSKEEPEFKVGDIIKFDNPFDGISYLKIQRIERFLDNPTYRGPTVFLFASGGGFIREKFFVKPSEMGNPEKVTEQEFIEVYEKIKEYEDENTTSQDVLTSQETVDDIQIQSGNTEVSKKDIKKLLTDVLAKIKEKTGNSKISLKKIKQITSALANSLKRKSNVDDDTLEAISDNVADSVVSGTPTPEPTGAASPDNPTQPDTEESDVEETPKEKGTPTWEKIKYAVAKVGGRYKVNGKLFGKKKIRKEEQEKIKALLEKESNKILKDVDDKIKESFPEFPNNESAKDFLSGVENIAAVYDTIVKGTEEGRVPVDVSNQMIHDLRDYVKNLLDVELKAFYATVDEQKEHDEYEDMLLEDAAADLRAKLKADREKRGGDTKGTSKFLGLIKKGPEDEFQSTKMSTLRSNKLPLTLAGVGSALGGFSWLVNTDWFKRLFDTVTPENYTKLVPEESKQLLSIKEGDGVYNFLSKTTGINLDANQDPQKLVDAFKKIGGGDANKGIELLCQEEGVMMRPKDAEKGLIAFIKNPSQYNNLGEFFKGEASGTGKLTPFDTTLYGTISGKQMVTTIIKMVPKVFKGSAIKTGAGYAIAKGFGSVLGPIGVGLLVGGATVKLMRMKGLKSSRAATLNGLYQSLRDLPEGSIVPTEGEVDDTVKPGVPEVPSTPPTSSSEEKFVINIPPEEEKPAKKIKKTAKKPATANKEEEPVSSEIEKEIKKEPKEKVKPKTKSAKKDKKEPEVIEVPAAPDTKTTDTASPKKRELKVIPKVKQVYKISNYGIEASKAPEEKKAELKNFRATIKKVDLDDSGDVLKIVYTNNLGKSKSINKEQWYKLIKSKTWQKVNPTKKSS